MWEGSRWRGVGGLGMSSGEGGVWEGGGGGREGGWMMSSRVRFTYGMEVWEYVCHGMHSAGGLR